MCAPQLFDRVDGGETQPAPQKLEPLIQEALEKNQEVAAARRRWEASRFRVPQVTTLPDPEVSIAPKHTTDFGQLGHVEYGVHQTFPFPGKLALRGRVAEEEARRVEAEYLTKRLEVGSLVKVAYHELFLAHKALEIKRREIEILKDFAKIAEGLYAVGKVTQQDVLRAQTVLAGLFRDLAPLEQRKASAEASLNALLARPPEAPLGVPEAPPPPTLPYKLEQLRALALEKRPELQARRADLARGEAALALAQRQLYPDIRVAVEYGQVWNGRDTLETTVGIHIPWLWGRPRYTAQAEEARAQIEAALAAKRATERRAFFEVEDLVAKLRSSERQAVLLRTSVLPLARQTLDAAIPGYQTGKVDFLSLLESQRALWEVELTYQQALVAFAQGRAELERAVGLELR